MMKRLLALLAMVLPWLTPLHSNAALLEFTNVNYRSWNGIFLHPIGAGPFIDDVVQIVNGENTGSEGPVIFSNDVGYASAYASSDFLNLRNSSSVDGSEFDQQLYDYGISEATTFFEADFSISDQLNQVSININAFYDESRTIDGPATTFFGAQRIRIFDSTGDLVLAYLRGNNDFVLDNDLLLDVGEMYRFTMSSTAYSRANSGGAVTLDRYFSAEILGADISFAVPTPNSLHLVLAGLTLLLLAINGISRPSTGGNWQLKLHTPQ